MLDLAATLNPWYAEHARELPWRGRGVSAWSVLVSEVMLQQTPVARVISVHESWLRRWPEPSSLARASAGDAVREWGRLGYPRRALRLHAAARAIHDHHAGVVPESLAELLALPGVGAYTARAVASFAFGQRHPVVDTNVRRVVTRYVDGHDDVPTPSPARDLAQVEPLLPADPATATTLSAALMELGALVCVARAPRCDACPLAGGCAWLNAGRPDRTLPRRHQLWAGTDRQARGAILEHLRSATRGADRVAVEALWSDADQRGRAVDGLVADGLAEWTAAGWLRLPR